MEENRRASVQVAYRVEPEVYKPWDDYVESGLIPGRCHHACAMLMYLWVRSDVRDAMQQTFAKFIRENVLEVPPILASDIGKLSPDETEVLMAYRTAHPKARKEALTRLKTPV